MIKALWAQNCLINPVDGKDGKDGDDCAVSVGESGFAVIRDLFSPEFQQFLEWRLFGSHQP